MKVRTGILSTAHLHAGGYAHAFATVPISEFVGIADEEPARGKAMADRFGTRFFESYEELAAECQAVAIASENVRHREFVELAAANKCHAICEKPLCTTVEDGKAMLAACASAGVQLMTCFPCRYAAPYQRLLARVRAGEIGKILAVCATNHGMMPQNSWFNVPALSGGGAMMDHTVHVMDLLRVLLGCEATEVYAETGNNMYHGEFDDVAMLTVRFDNGVFATIDSSWSRPVSYKTWGDVTINVVGETGVIEMDMFSQAVMVYDNADMRAREAGYGSGLDGPLMNDFLTAVATGAPVPISGYDGLKAAEVAIGGYLSARSAAPVALPL